MERRLHDDPSISDLESDLENAFDSLRELDYRGRLPYELRPLLALAPPEGASVHVSLRERESGRRIRRTSASSAFDPRQSAAWIVYEVPQPAHFDGGRGGGARYEPQGARYEPQAARGYDGDPLADFLTALDHAEREPHLHFISLKWFRDTYLAKRGYGWAHDPDIPRRLIQEATERDLILTSKVPNPKQPTFPVTSIRLNRLHPDVRKVVGDEPPPEREGGDAQAEADGSEG